MNRCEKSAFRLKSVLWLLPVTVVLVMGMLPSGVAYAGDCVVTRGVTQSGNIVTGTNRADQIYCADATRPLIIHGESGIDQLTGTQYGDTI